MKKVSLFSQVAVISSGIFLFSAGLLGVSHAADGVLDLIGKATPGTFQPSLQIDGTGAKLLIEALSGRWSYDTERREKRTVWYHVANAFSLLVATIAPMRSNEQIKVISNYDR